jgi:hypothetical protein
VNEGVNIAPGGQISPLVTRGEVNNGLFDLSGITRPDAEERKTRRNSALKKRLPTWTRNLRYAD